MNKRKNIYRGMNRRRNNTAKVISLGLVIACIAGGVIFVKKSDFSIAEKISNLNFLSKKNTSIQEFSYDDVVDKNNKSKDKQAEVKNEDAKVATVENFDIYSIQIAAIDNQAELDKIENKLNELKVPFSIVEIDSIKKVQTYASFTEEESRKHLDSIKKDFEDAFISKLEVPLLGLQYTEKYVYVEDICKEINNLITNFKEESKIWDKGDEGIDKEKYKNIINSRLETLSKLEKHAKSINYEGMKGFKENLLTYTKSIEDKSKESLKKVEQDKNYMGESLFISSMQGYYSFVNSIKTI
ncbi:MAG: hypothetical protein ACRCYC_07450 [Paraclostridium sp.]|uniref:hypothetical protein n=1 Tax=Paraclostridium sp. TaxID=2023273 RepID=UPI003F384F58